MFSAICLLQDNILSKVNSNFEAVEGKAVYVHFVLK